MKIKDWEKEFDKLSQTKMTTKEFIRNLLSQQKREMVVNVSSLRQWLNEDRITDSKKMVTNKEILIWFKQNLTK